MSQICSGSTGFTFNKDWSGESCRCIQLKFGIHLHIIYRYIPLIGIGVYRVVCTALKGGIIEPCNTNFFTICNGLVRTNSIISQANKVVSIESKIRSTKGSIYSEGWTKGELNRPTFKKFGGSRLREVKESGSSNFYLISSYICFTGRDLIDSKIITWCITLISNLIGIVDTSITKSIVQTVVNGGEEVTNIIMTRLIKSPSSQFITKNVVISTSINFSQNTILNFCQLNKVLVIKIIRCLLKESGRNFESISTRCSVIIESLSIVS